MARYDAEQIVKRIDSLIAKSDKVLLTQRDSDTHFFQKLVDGGQFREWQTQSLAFLIDTLRPQHTYSVEFAAVKVEGVTSIEKGAGILRAVREDVQAGHLRGPRSLISADIFTDFLEMADHLLSEGYKDAAAVMVGGALEGHLRQLCQKNAIGLEDVTAKGTKPKKAEKMNADLASGGAYSKTDQKNVTSWLAIRNHAAHAEYEKYTQGQVVLFLAHVRDFITRVPA